MRISLDKATARLCTQVSGPEIQSPVEVQQKCHSTSRALARQWQDCQDPEADWGLAFVLMTLQGKLKELGISPPQEAAEPDLEAVLKDNLSQLPAPVKELVEKITKPQPPTEKDVAIKLKQQVSTLRDLSNRKQTLQTKIDATKKAFQDLLEEMKTIQSKIEQEQAELNTTSTAYMSLVSKQPDPVQLSEDADMKDPVPEAVAGFISTLGVNLTQAQHDQLKTMLKRPPATNEEDPKRRKTADEEKDQSCG